MSYGIMTKTLLYDKAPKALYVPHEKLRTVVRTKRTRDLGKQYVDAVRTCGNCLVHHQVRSYIHMGNMACGKQ